MSKPMIDVAHPCWTGVENEFDHDWQIEEWDQGDPSTPYYQSGVARVCAVCLEVDENWYGPEGDDYNPEEWR